MSIVEQINLVPTESAQKENEVGVAELTIPDDWKVLGDPADWAQFYDTELLRLWSVEAKESVSAKDTKLWQLIGSSLLIQIEDEEEASRMLHRAAFDAGLAFVRVPSDEVEGLAEDPRGRFTSLAPVLVMLEFGEWAQGRVGDVALFSSETGPLDNKFTKAFRKKLRHFDVMHPIVFALCAKKIEAVSDELQRVGGFDRIFLTEAPSPEFLGNRFLKQLGTDVAGESLRSVPAKVGMMLQSEFEDVEAQNLAALNLQRLARRQAREVDFNDLANLAIRGRTEQSTKVNKTASEQTRHKTACHEAGHACIAVIASDGANIPDYASIVPSKAFEGVVFESLSFYDQQDEFTFQNLLLKTRILLAGRAAEEFFFGPINVSSGANSDLAAATRICFRMFAYSGFNPDMGKGTNSASNLAVLERGEVDPMQNDRVSRDVRQFLAEQYNQVLSTLEQHRQFVEAVAKRLLWDPVIDQGEMAELAGAHGIAIAA